MIKLCAINEHTDCPCLSVPESDSLAEIECNLGYVIERATSKHNLNETLIISRNCKLESIVLSEPNETGERLLQPITINENDIEPW